MEVKPVVEVVTQKLTDTLNESVADNKVMMHQLKGIQRSLLKLKSFSKETERDRLNEVYQVEDEVEKFTFKVATRQRKRFGFLTKQTFFFNNIDSCRRLKQKIKKISAEDDISPSSVSKSNLWEQRNSTKSSSDETTEEEEEDLNDDNEGFFDETHVLTQKSSSSVWPVSEIPSTPTSPALGVLTRSFTMIRYLQENVQQRKKLTFSYSYNDQEMDIVGFKEERIQHPKQMSNFSYQEEELGIFGLNDDIKSLVKRLTEKSVSRLDYDFKCPVKWLAEKSVSRLDYDLKTPVKQRKGMFVPIVGGVGSGKTTLARAVYRNRKIKDHFEFHDWISVMEDYTAQQILVSMSKKVLTVKDNGPMSPKDQELKNRVFNHLKGKRYLIVLDGVGNSGVVEDLKDIFPDENNGSKVLFTSREVVVEDLKDIFPDENNGSKVLFTSREVRICPGQHIMGQLNEEESWNMFLKKSGKEKKTDKIEPRLKYRILEICRGLPLNIVLIAGLLTKRRITRWSSAISRGNYCSDEEVLSLCYNDLTDHLKLCLLYLTLFPKDYDIPVRRLLRLWLAEGFVTRSSQQQVPEDLVQKHFKELSSQQQFPEDLVQKYFEELVQRSMIQITKLRSDNSPRHCRLVSVLHDYLLPRAKDISLFYIRHNLESTEDAEGPFGVRRMVQHMTTGTRERLNSIPLDLQQSEVQNSTFDPSLVRSYVSFNFQRKDMPAREVGMFLGRIINRDYRLLRVLDLEGVNKPTLPDNLGHLCLLRYLGLRRTYLESLPESVGDLSYLETLDVKHTRVDSLPDSIWKLKQLRHLNLNNIRLAMPPSSSLTLLTLWGLVLDEKIIANEGLGKLLDLRELGIKFNLSEKSQGVLLDWVAKLENLQSLRLTSVNDMGRPSKLVLKPLAKLYKLSHLHLYGNLQRLPDPIEFPPTLKVLTLSISQLSMDPMKTLEQLPCLIVLRLLANSFTGERMVCHRGGFKKLRVLKLWVLKELEEWDVEEEAMESLKELEIRCCHKLKNIPSRLLQKQKCLEELILTGMPDEFVAQTKKRKSKDTSLTINPWKFAP